MAAIIIILLTSLWSLLIIDFFEPFKQLKDKIGMGYSRTLVSDRIGIDYILYLIHKIMNCSSCFSSYFIILNWFIYFGNFYGILLMPVCFFLTWIIKEKLLTINL